MEIIFAGIVIVFMVIFLVMMWMIYSGMKKFLSDNIEEALIVSGDYIGDRVKDLHSTMTGRMNALENENRTLRAEISRRLDDLSSIISDADDKSGQGISRITDEISRLAGTLTGNAESLRNENATLRREITQRLDAISAIITDANNKSEAGAGSIVKELNNVVPAMRDEMNKLLETLSQNADSFQRNTIRNLEDEISQLIEAVDTSCKRMAESSNQQASCLADMAGTFQGVIAESANNLQSELGQIHSGIRNIINNSMDQIKDAYGENIKIILQVMADNLAAIIDKLRTAGAEGSFPANNADILPAENTPETKSKRGRPKNNPKQAAEKKPETSPEVTDKEKEDSNDAA